MISYGTANFYDNKERTFFNTTLFYCVECDILSRDICEDSIEKHLQVASFTDIKNEKRFFSARQNYFQYIAYLLSRELKSHKKTRPIVIDFGCSYGHFQNVAKNFGFRVIGVEKNLALIDYVRQKDMEVFRDIGEITVKADAVVMIDSLYYISNPKDILNKISQLLKDNGILLIRVTNRIWLLKARKLFTGSINFGNLLGDAIVGYSLKGLSLLLKSSNYSIKKVCLYEKSKNMNFSKRMFYLFSLFLSNFFFRKVIFTPGITVIAEKKG